jgi:hypothetical protein
MSKGVNHDSILSFLAEASVGCTCTTIYQPRPTLPSQVDRDTSGPTPMERFLDEPSHRYGIAFVRPGLWVKHYMESGTQEMGGDNDSGDELVIEEDPENDEEEKKEDNGIGDEDEMGKAEKSAMLAWFLQ